jgi:hypothetical protein
MNRDQSPTPPWLKVAQIAWLIMTLFVVVAFVRAAPIFYQNQATLCTLPAEECAQYWLLGPSQLEQLQVIQMSLTGWAVFTLGTRVIGTLVYLVLGTFIFIRKRNDPMALLTAYLFVTFGTSNGVMGELAKLSPTWGPAIFFISTLGWICLILFFSVFPNGQFVPRFIRWVAIAFVTFFLFGYFFPQTADQINAVWVGSMFLSLFVTMLVAQFYRYKWVSTPVERKQTKWVVYGIVAMSACITAVISFSLSSSNLASSTFQILFTGGLSEIIILLLPLSIGMAILRSSLFDIDVIIRKTLLYGALTALLGLVYFGIVVLLQELFGLITGQANSPLANVISTLAIAALFNPLRARLQAFIDRRFFRQKYNAEQAVEAYAAHARSETDLVKLTEELIDTIQNTLQPEGLSLWIAEGKLSMRERKNHHAN